MTGCGWPSRLGSSRSAETDRERRRLIRAWLRSMSEKCLRTGGKRTGFLQNLMNRATRLRSIPTDELRGGRLPAYQING